MKTGDLKDIEKEVSEYKKWCLNKKNKNPFKTQDAYWAAGLENFLTWLSEKNNDESNN